MADLKRTWQQEDIEHIIATLEPLEQNDAFIGALLAARRLKAGLQDKPTEGSPAIVVQLRFQQVHALRAFAVGAGWFEVPGTNVYEHLRMVDPKSGNTFVVYEGKRGFKGVADVGHPAARELISAWARDNNAH